MDYQLRFDNKPETTNQISNDPIGIEIIKLFHILSDLPEKANPP